MPVPDFSPGEVLTAAAMDRIGLWHITTVSPTPATTIAVNNCFNSSFNSYRIIVSPIGVAATISADTTFRLRVGGVPSGSNYYMTTLFIESASVSSNSENNTSNFRFLATASNNNANNFVTCELHYPFNTTVTKYENVSSGWAGSAIRQRRTTGFHDQNLSYDGFELNAATNITGTISVYGYNKG
jgi:hypothetical protein